MNFGKPWNSPEKSIDGNQRPGLSGHPSPSGIIQIRTISKPDHCGLQQTRKSFTQQVSGYTEKTGNPPVGKFGTMPDKPYSQNRAMLGGFQKVATFTDEGMKGYSIEGDETLRNFFRVNS